MAESGSQKIRLQREPRLDAKMDAYAYQAEAFHAIKDLAYAAIFHEQGLGKSKIAIDLALYWLERRQVDTVLVVAKKQLVRNWEREIRQHTFMRPKILTQNRRANFYAFNSPARLMLTHYETFKGERERLKLFLKTRSVAVILDESAKIKNPEAELTQVFFELAPLFVRRVIMTGTPVTNRPYDIWAQIWFLDQGNSLGNDFKSFRKAYDLRSSLEEDPDSQAAFEERLDALSGSISDFTVRRTKESGVLELPEKLIENVFTDWEEHQLELYEQLRIDLRAVIVKDGIPSEDAAEEVLKRLLRLVQTASNPRLFDESYSAEPGKVCWLRDLVEAVCAAGEKCIIWTAFTGNVDWLAVELSHHGSARVHGGLSMELRNKSIDKFLTDPDTRILVATPGAAKEGLTLTVANHVIFYDRTFSLDDYLQAQDRIHRISQTKRCFVRNLVMQDSIDEWIDVLLEQKRLAAQLAQGDISRSYYNSQATYTFGAILKEVLGLPDQEEDTHVK
jgi:SNF2 family DNA or RNA helicase